MWSGRNRHAANMVASVTYIYSIPIAATLIAIAFLSAYHVGFHRGWKAAWNDMKKSVMSSGLTIPKYEVSGAIPPMFEPDEKETNQKLEKL